VGGKKEFKSGWVFDSPIFSPTATYETCFHKTIEKKKPRETIKVSKGVAPGWIQDSKTKKTATREYLGVDENRKN